jgi:hypothetical protein
VDLGLLLGFLRSEKFPFEFKEFVDGLSNRRLFCRDLGRDVNVAVMCYDYTGTNLAIHSQATINSLNFVVVFKLSPALNRIWRKHWPTFCLKLASRHRCCVSVVTVQRRTTL